MKIKTSLKKFFKNFHFWGYASVRNRRFFCLSMFLCSLLLPNRQVLAQSHTAVKFKSAEYSIDSKLQCGDAEIKIETYCQDDDRLIEACFLQKLTFSR